VAEKIEFDIKVRSNELTKAFDDATTGSKKLSETVSNALGVFGGNLAIKGFEALGRAVGNATEFVSESIDAAAEQEAALNRLAQALRATSSFSEQALADFSAFSSELQKNSKFADDVILNQIAVAKSLGATNQQAKDLVIAAANLSATLGGSLEDNVFKLGKTLNGLVSRDLKALAPELAVLSKSALDAGGAIGIINSKFGGAAAAEITTYAGQVGQLSKSYGELQESIGGFITGSSLVKSSVSVVSSLLDEITQRIEDYRNEQARANGTIVETDYTLTSLSEKYSKVRDEIEKYQAVVDADKSKTLLESIFSFDNAPLARERVQALTGELAKLDAQIVKASEQVASQQAPVETKPPVDPQIEAQAVASRIETFNQLSLARLEFDATQDQLNLERRTLEGTARQADFDAVIANETALVDAKYAAELEKTKLITDEVAKRQAIEAIDYKKKDDLQKSAGKREIESAKAQLALRKTLEEQKAQIIMGSFGLASALAKDGSKEQFIIQKAAALADIALARGKAIGAIPAQTAMLPYPLVPAAQAQLLANANLQAGIGTATVLATAIKGFANGGVVGASMGPDNRLATVRDGEMILNAQQQESLFKMINNGSMGGDIIVQVDGREIARAVRNQVQQGYKIA
jgi:hypothetical protein